MRWVFIFFVVLSFGSISLGQEFKEAKCLSEFFSENPNFKINFEETVGSQLSNFIWDQGVLYRKFVGTKADNAIKFPSTKPSEIWNATTGEFSKNGSRQPKIEAVKMVYKKVSTDPKTAPLLNSFEGCKTLGPFSNESTGLPRNPKPSEKEPQAIP